MTRVPSPPAERAEARPCKVCGGEIVAGQLYVVAGPHHVFCHPPSRLNVHLLVNEARGR